MKISVLRLFVLTVILLCFGVSVEAAQKKGAAPKDESMRRGETRVTLDPEQFDNARVKQAYKAAKEIPWVLDSIYCYCQCEESAAFRHKSLLSCYVDNHAAV